MSLDDTEVGVSVTDPLQAHPDLNRDQVYNGDFSLPPRDPLSAIDNNSNPLPGWSFTQSVGTGTIAAWWMPPLSGDPAYIEWRTTAAATSDEAYLEQSISVTRTDEKQASYFPAFGVIGSVEQFIYAVFLDENAAVYGPSAELLGNQTMPVLVAGSGQAGPGAAGLLIRVGRRVQAGPDTDALPLSEVFVDRATIGTYVPDMFGGAHGPGRLRNQAGEVTVEGSPPSGSPTDPVPTMFLRTDGSIRLTPTTGDPVTVSTFVDLPEQAAPATPPATTVRLYPKADGLLYSKDDAGVETGPFGSGGGGGAVATDTIWDAKGDLAVGTGANTAAVLTVGANLKVLAADSTQATGLIWDTVTGTSSVVRATSPTLVTPALGTPTALVGTNITGTAASLTAGTVTTNANLTGDVTSVGNAATIPAGKVTLAMMANIATDRLIGRDTAATGVPEAIALATSLEWTGSASIQRSALTGDVTAPAGSNATTLAAGSASNLNSGTLPAGRLPALTGDVTSSAGSAATTLAAGSASNLNSGTLPAGRMPALTGDVTTSAGAVATTIGAGKVTLAMQANLAQDLFIGRVTASTGVPETATITAAARTVLDDTTVGAMVDTVGGATATGTGGLVRLAGPTMTGTLTVPTVTANGIIFPATQVDAAGANTLDDYEEGSWTPVISFDTVGNLNVVYSTQVGTYTKIGNRVLYNANIVTSTFTYTTSTGNFLITGLPFTVVNTAGAGGAGAVIMSGWTKANYTFLSFAHTINTTQGTIQAGGSGQAIAALTVTECISGTQKTVRVSGHYAMA